MPTLIVPANAFANVTSTAAPAPWASTANAYVDDTNAATGLNGSTAKNASTVGAYGFPAITAGQIPDGATIDEVRVAVRGYLSVTNVAGGVLGIEPRIAATAAGSESTVGNSSTPTDLVAAFTTTPTLANLRSGGAAGARAFLRAAKGNSTSALTVFAEHVWLEVDYTVEEAPQHFDRTATDSIPIGADTVIASVTPPSGGGAGVLLVVGDPAALTAADIGIRDRLQGMGHTVTIRDDDAADTGANDFALIVISESTTNNVAIMGGKYKGSTTGILDHKHNAWHMRGLVTVTTAGIHTDQTDVSITPDEHPVRGSVPSGQRALHTAPVQLRHSTNTHGSGAFRIAFSRPGHGFATDWYIFAHEAGSTLADSTAAAGRRVAFTLHSATNAFGTLTADGLALWDNAVAWLIGTGGGGGQHFDRSATDNVPIGSDSVVASVTPGGGAGPLAADTFTRTVSNGWGTADTGGAWTNGANPDDSVAASAYAVDGSRATLALTQWAVGSGRLSSVSALNVNALVRINFSALPSSGRFNAYVTLRQQANGDRYQANIGPSPTGDMRCRITRRSGGTGTTIADTPNLARVTPATANTDYWLRFEAFGTNPTTVRIRVWRHDQAEPGTWDHSVTDSTAELQQAGFIGLIGYHEGANAVTLRFDDLQAESTDAPAPPAGNILFVNNWPDGANASDLAIVARLQSQGHTVAWADDDDITPEWANGRQLIIVSKTVTSTKVADKFKNATCGIIFWEDNNQQLAHFATIDSDDTANTSWHSPTTNIVLSAAAPAALRANLTGTQAFYTSSAEATFAPKRLSNDLTTLAAGSIKIAEFNTGGSKIWVLYAYEQGVALADGTPAAGRRYYFGLNDNTFTLLTSNGLALWDAAVAWALATPSGGGQHFDRTATDSIPIGADTVVASVNVMPPFLSRPASGALNYTSGTNLVIENLSFSNLDAIAIRLENVNGATIRNCDFYNTRTAIRALNCSNIVVEDCRYMDLKETPHPYTQFVQFDKVSGGAIRRNRGKGGKTEDIINMWESNGTQANPIIIEYNHFEGVDWTSNSGSGIGLGDGGGTWQVARNNILVNPGQVGAFIAGGANNRLEDNIIIGQQRPLSNVGIYIWDHYSLGTCNLNSITGNRVHWINAAGAANHFWNGGGCTNSTITGNVWGDTSLNIEDYRVDLDAPITSFPRTLADSIPIGVDTAAIIVTRARSAVDSIAIGSDSPAVTKATGRSASDATSVSEQVDRVLAAGRTASDAAPIGADSIATGGGVGRFAADSVPIGSDAPVIGTGVGRAAVDSIPVGADEPAVTKTTSRTVTDVTSVSEQVGGGQARSSSVTDSVPIGADVIATGGGVGRFATDAVPIGADTVARSAVFGRSIADSVPIGSDSVARGIAIGRVVMDVTTVSDSIATATPQRALPISQVSNLGWEGEDGRTENLHVSIADQNDMTFVRSDLPDASKALVVAIAPMANPGTNLGHRVHYRYSGNGVDDLVVQLLQGSTVIATWTHEKPDVFVQEATQTLTQQQAAAITNYSTLRVRMRGV